MGVSLVIGLALFTVFAVGYWFGRAVQKHLPNHHLRPWKWGKRRD